MLLDKCEMHVNRPYMELDSFTSLQFSKLLFENAESLLEKYSSVKPVTSFQNTSQAGQTGYFSSYLIVTQTF